MLHGSSRVGGNEIDGGLDCDDRRSDDLYGAGVGYRSHLLETRRNSDQPKRPQLAGISPSLLAEIQTVILPLSVVASALAAKVFYLDLVRDSSAPVSFYVGAGILGAIVTCVVSSQSRIHSTQTILAGELKAHLIAAIVSLSFLFLLCIFYLLKISDHFSRGWLATWYVLTIVFFLVERLGILLWARLLRAENRLLQRVAIYGAPELVERVADELFAGDHNLVLAGVFSDEENPPIGRLPFAGGINSLISVAQTGACDRVVLALRSDAPEKIRDAVASLDVLPIMVQLSPDAMTLPGLAGGAQETGGLVLLDLQRPPLSARGMLLKTVTDYVIGSIALVLFAPVMLVIAIAIKLDSCGSVFFVQSRNGYNHRVIRVVKFRTMTVSEDGPVVTQAVYGDKRVTPLGHFLRRTSLDELPQLFNVLRGELSLVGPRPHAVTHNDSYSRILASYASRHKVKPGITGLAQVNGFRGETKTPEEMRQRVDLDLDYIQHWSLWLDIEILARTALVPFFSSRAY